MKEKNNQIIIRKNLGNSKKTKRKQTKKEKMPNISTNNKVPLKLSNYKQTSKDTAEDKLLEDTHPPLCEKWWFLSAHIMEHLALVETLLKYSILSSAQLCDYTESPEESYQSLPPPNAKVSGDTALKLCWPPPHY